MMVNLMRTNQRWLMIIISVLVIVSFIVFYSNRASSDRVVSDRVGSIYDRSVSSLEFDRVGRRLAVAQSLGTYSLLNAVYAGSASREVPSINYLVLEHQAALLGIEPTQEEIQAAGEKLPVFQGPGGEFDPIKHADFVQRELSPRGMGPLQIDELVRMNLIADKIHNLVTSTVIISPIEAQTRYEQGFATTSASVLRLKTADYSSVPEPTEEEIKKYFNDQKDQFKQPERRKVQYVKFGLDDAQQKLKDRSRMEALKPLADGAAQFLEKLLDQKGKENFAAAAAADGLAVKETPEFEEDQSVGLEEAKIPQFTQMAFGLSKQNPDSDVPLETPDAFYDLHLSAVAPERPLTLDEARPKIIAAIKADRTHAALTAKAEEIRTKIAAALKAGRSFADAAKEAGQTAQDLPPFSLAEMQQGGAEEGVKQAASVSLTLATGELSKFTPDADGGFLVFVRGRNGVDPARSEAAKEGFAAQYQQQKSREYFSEWMRTSRDDAHPRFNLRSQG